LARASAQGEHSIRGDTFPKLSTISRAETKGVEFLYSYGEVAGKGGEIGKWDKILENREKGYWGRGGKRIFCLCSWYERSKNQEKFQREGGKGV